MSEREQESKNWILRAIDETAKAHGSAAPSALDKLRHDVARLDASHRLFHTVSLLNDDARDMFEENCRLRLAGFGVERVPASGDFVEQLLVLADECARRYHFKDE